MDDTAPYFVRVLGKVHYQPGSWHGLRVGVFRREDGADVQVGEYERNYPSLLRTFAPFRVADRELALYSPDYTCTRLLELPSCRDIGGEEPDGGGFCPVDFFVPYFIDLEYRVDDQPPRRFRRQMPAAEDLGARTITRTLPATAQRQERLEHQRYTPLGKLTYHPFGFMAGCIWGDDSSWKLQYLDLSKAADGILRREERFGYVELPDGLPLEKAVDLGDYQSDPGEDHAHQIRITLTKRFDVRTGREIDPLS